MFTVDVLSIPSTLLKIRNQESHMPAGAKKTTKATRRKKTNLNRLYSNMNKLTVDAVDNEIMRRFKLLIDASEEDMPKIVIDSLLANPSSSDPSVFPEGLQPYIKHYIFMSKRNK